jgi:hypothetical protein
MEINSKNCEDHGRLFCDQVVYPALFGYEVIERYPYSRPEVQQRYGDVKVRDRKGNVWFVEEKANTHYVQLMPIEVTQDVLEGQQGWLKKLDKCDQMVWLYFSENKPFKLYFIEDWKRFREDMINAVKNWQGDRKPLTIYNYTTCTLAMLIPWDQLIKEGHVQEIHIPEQYLR